MIPPEMLKVSLPGGRNQPQEGMPMGVEQMDFMEGVTVVKVGGGGGANGYHGESNNQGRLRGEDKWISWRK